jgi:hypothetical protein
MVGNNFDDFEKEEEVEGRERERRTKEIAKL